MMFSSTGPRGQIMRAKAFLPGGRAEPVRGTRDWRKTRNVRFKPAFWFASQPPFYMQRRDPCQE